MLNNRESYSHPYTNTSTSFSRCTCSSQVSLCNKLLDATSSVPRSPAGEHPGLRQNRLAGTGLNFLAQAPAAHKCCRSDPWSQKGAWKCDPVPSSTPLPERGIRCRDASVQPELRSPLRASNRPRAFLAPSQRLRHRARRIPAVPQHQPHARSLGLAHATRSLQLCPRQPRGAVAQRQQPGEEARREALRTRARSSHGVTAKEARSR